MLKLFKEEIIEINGEEIPIRAYRNADADLAANMIKNQIKIEENQADSEANSADLMQYKKEMEDNAHILAQRGLKRVYVNDFDFRTSIEDLDSYDDYEIDPDYELQIAWLMVRLGTSGMNSDGKKQTPPKRRATKKSSKKKPS